MESKQKEETLTSKLYEDEKEALRAGRRKPRNTPASDPTKRVCGHPAIWSHYTLCGVCSNIGLSQ